jgi:hypothetical protein
LVTRPEGGRRSRVALFAPLLAVLACGLLAWSCRERAPTGARADNRPAAGPAAEATAGPGAASGRLLIIATGNTQAALETCS